MLITKMDRINKNGGNNRIAPTLEREVIISTVALYLLICGALLAVHHFQPPGQETTTSSTSPSHQHFSTPGN